MPAAASPWLMVKVGIAPVAHATGIGLPLLRSCSSSCRNVTIIVGSIYGRANVAITLRVMRLDLTCDEPTDRCLGVCETEARHGGA